MRHFTDSHSEKIPLYYPEYKVFVNFYIILYSMAPKQQQTKLFRAVFKRAQVFHAIYKNSWQSKKHRKDIHI